MRLIAVLFTAFALQGSALSGFAFEQRPGDWQPSIVSHPGAVAVEPARIQAGNFRLIVPFRTQKDGSRWQGSNCGPAILGMVLDGYGILGQGTEDLRYRSHTYQGTVGVRTGTALHHIAQVAEDFGVQTYGLYESDGRFHSWTVDEIREQLRLGRPVMPLVRLYLLPGYESSLPRWGHYVLITGLNDQGFYYSDPLIPEPASGASGFMPAEQLMSAMQASHLPGQAVSFGGPALAVWVPPGAG